MGHSNFAPEGTHSPRGPSISRRVVNSYAGQRASGSGCERLVSTKFFRIATSKPKASEAISGLKINENGCNFKDFKKMSAGPNLHSFPSGRHSSFSQGCSSSSVDKHSLCTTYSLPLLVMASRVLSFPMSSAAHSAAKPTCSGRAASRLTTPLGRGPTGRTPHC